MNFGMEYMWELCQDCSRIEPGIFSVAVDGFQTLIKDPNYKQLREEYLTKCCDNVKKGSSVAQSLVIAYTILTTFNQQNMFFQNQSYVISI